MKNQYEDFMNKFKQAAFTLAEVLITLGIIGIVAAMTIPTLMNNVQDMQLKIAWKKEYSVLSNAFSLVLQENGGNIKGSCTDNGDGTCILTLMASKLNIIKQCTPATTKGACWHNNGSVKNYGGGSGDERMTTGLILNDGSFVSVMWGDGQNCNNDSSWRKNCGRLFIDVNGFKSPNIEGRDIFRLYVDEDHLFPTGSNGDWVYTNLPTHGCNQSDNTNIESGLGCSALYLNQ